MGVERNSDRPWADINMAIWRWYAPGADHLFAVLGSLGGLRRVVLSTRCSSLGDTKCVDQPAQPLCDVEATL